MPPSRRPTPSQRSRQSRRRRKKSQQSGAAEHKVAADEPVGKAEGRVRSGSVVEAEANVIAQTHLKTVAKRIGTTAPMLTFV